MKMCIYSYFKVKKDGLLKLIQIVTDKAYGGFTQLT